MRKTKRSIELMFTSILLLSFFITDFSNAFAQVREMTPKGGAGGAYFRDEGEIRSIVIRSGSWIDGVQLITKNGQRKPLRGGSGGGEHIFRLQAGEYITAISGSAVGSFGQYVSQIRIQTNRRTSPLYGNSRGRVTFNFRIPNGSKFVGFTGRSGRYLHALGVLYKSSVGQVSTAPTLLTPSYNAIMDNGCSNSSNDVRWNFKWNPVSGASRYNIWVKNGNSQNPVINDFISTNYYNHYKANSYIANHLLTGWNWYVRAEVNGVWGPWSSARSFSVEAINSDCGSATAVVAPNLNAPYVNATLANGCADMAKRREWNFSWNRVNGADLYNLYVYKLGSQNPLINTTVSATYFKKVFTSGYITNQNLNGWRWKVKSRVNGQWSNWSTERAFYVQAPKNCKTVAEILAPTLSAPYTNASLANGCVDLTKRYEWNFSWNRVNGARLYNIRVYRQGSQNTLVNSQVSSNYFKKVFNGGYVAKHNLSGWVWQVRAQVNGQWSTWSSSRRFYVQPPKTCKTVSNKAKTVRFVHKGVYIAKFKITYNVNGQQKVWKSGNKNNGYAQTVTLPSNATNINISGHANTGFTWALIFNQYPKNTKICVKVWGTVFDPKFGGC